MSVSPIPEVCDYKRSVLVDVVFSREAYYPGNIMSCMLTLKKPATAQNDIYFEWLAVQIHGHVAVDPHFALLPATQSKSKKTPMSTLPNIKNLETDDCMCLYQSTPFVLESDCYLDDHVKKYMFQIQIPEDVPPSLKCSSVKYFHLFSIILSFPNSPPRTYITEFKVHLPPTYQDPTHLYDYPSFFTPINTYKMVDLSLRVSPLSISMSETNQQEQEDDIYINNDVSIYNDNIQQTKNMLQSNDIIRNNTIPSVFSITCQDKLIGKIKISTDNVHLGESIFINFDTSDSEFKCLRILVSLRLSQYLPAMNYVFFKEKTVTHINMNTLSSGRCPIYISVPSFSPPSITTQQIQLRWSLFFVFTVQHEYTQTPNPEDIYTFDPSTIPTSTIENIEWTIPITVYSPEESGIIEKIGDIPMFLGDENIFTLSPIKPSIV
ncbi:hypothetical protein WA158_003679 [Blastocystis sp. Blastoise]